MKYFHLSRANPPGVLANQLEAGDDRETENSPTASLLPCLLSPRTASKDPAVDQFVHPELIPLHVTPTAQYDSADLQPIRAQCLDCS